MSSKPLRIISLFLLFVSAIGVTFSGPLILGWVSEPTPFFDLGPTAAIFGGYLDIIGGLLEFIMIVYMISIGIFSGNANTDKSIKSFKIMAGICVIGLIADPLGGLFAIAAQIGLYTSLVNIYLLQKNK
ncbi:hypothetical protein ACFL96_14630 [Thermoproteota archaeon]